MNINNRQTTVTRSTKPNDAAAEAKAAAAETKAAAATAAAATAAAATAAATGWRCRLLQRRHFFFLSPF